MGERITVVSLNYPSFYIKDMEPEDTCMYEPMRFCCVDDPVGIRIDVYCPIAG